MKGNGEESGGRIDELLALVVMILTMVIVIGYTWKPMPDLIPDEAYFICLFIETLLAAVFLWYAHSRESNLRRTALRAATENSNTIAEYKTLCDQMENHIREMWQRIEHSMSGGLNLETFERAEAFATELHERAKTHKAECERLERLREEIRLSAGAMVELAIRLRAARPQQKSDGTITVRECGEAIEFEDWIARARRQVVTWMLRLVALSETERPGILKRIPREIVHDCVYTDSMREFLIVGKHAPSWGLKFAEGLAPPTFSDVEVHAAEDAPAPRSLQTPGT